MSIKVRAEDLQMLTQKLARLGVQTDDAPVVANRLWEKREVKGWWIFRKTFVDLPDHLVVDPKAKQLVSTPKFPVVDSTAALLHQYSLDTACGACDYFLINAASIAALNKPSDSR